MTIDTKPSIPTPREPVERLRDRGDASRDAVSIIVNGRRHVVDRAAIDHGTVVGLAFPGSGSNSFLVTFREGPLDRATGFLVPGHGTPIVEDQVFHVAAAVQS